MSENNYTWDSKVPATAEQKEFTLPPIGEYNFIVVGADKTYSSNGNPMIKLRLELQGADGSVWDNLTITDNMMWRVVTFLESVGLKKKGKDLDISIGEAVDKCLGLEGRCKIKHETYNNKLNAKVDKYLVPTAKKAAKAPKATVEESSFDDVPFEID